MANLDLKSIQMHTYMYTRIRKLHLFTKKLPPHTLVGVDLTTHESAGRGDTTRPRANNNWLFEPWRHGLVVSPLPATEETGALGLEVESRLGLCGVVA
jgi:hypothetical protein